MQSNHARLPRVCGHFLTTSEYAWTKDKKWSINLDDGTDVHVRTTVVHVKLAWAQSLILGLLTWGKHTGYDTTGSYDVLCFVSHFL